MPRLRLILLLGPRLSVDSGTRGMTSSTGVRDLYSNCLYPFFVSFIAMKNLGHYMEFSAVCGLYLKRCVCIQRNFLEKVHIHV